MPAYAVTCKCGERFQVEEEHLGQLITCWRCKRVLKLKSPLAAPSQYIHVEKPGRTAGERLAGWMHRLRRGIESSWSIAETPRRPLSMAAKVLTLAAWIVLGGSLAAALLMRGLGDRFLPATLLLFSGRWIFALPVVGVLVLAVFVRRAVLFPGLLAVPVVLFGLMDFHTGWRTRLPAAKGLPIRVVTVNVGEQARIPDEFLSYLNGWRADIVAIQECGPVLPEKLRLMPGWHTHRSEGLCLVSRFPIRAAEVMDRASLDRVRSDTDSRVGGAGFVVRYMLDTPAGPLGFTNLHLETARKGLETLLDGFDFKRFSANAEIRAIEARRAREWVDGGVIPMIVAGDFNAPAESRNIRDNWSDLTNAFGVSGSGFGATKYNGWIRLRIDHVLYTSGVRASRSRVGGDMGSDHRPLIVDLRILERVDDR